MLVVVLLLVGREDEGERALVGRVLLVTGSLEGEGVTSALEADERRNNVEGGGDHGWSD